MPVGRFMVSILVSFARVRTRRRNRRNAEPQVTDHPGLAADATAQTWKAGALIRAYVVFGSATAVSCRTPAASAPVSHASRLYVDAAAHPRYGLPPIRSMK